MPHEIHMMVLPGAVENGPPQILLEDGGLWRETAKLEVRARLRGDIEKHLTRIMQQVGAGAPITPQGAAFRNPLIDARPLLMPREIRDVVAKVRQDAFAQGDRPILNIYFHQGVEWIPWELLHDGNDFLGIQCAIARLPIVTDPAEVRPPRRRAVQKICNLLAKDVLDANLTQSWQGLFNGSPSERRFPSNGTANFPTLADLEQDNDADVIHVLCHGGLREDSEPEAFWTLDHRNPRTFDYRIKPADARNFQFKSRPLVFGNACSSASAQNVDFASMQSFGASFLIGGALNFIGTFAPIRRDIAVEFAARFFRRLFGTPPEKEAPIAEALRSTKESFAKDGYTDPSYLFYCLYGPGDSTFVPN
jgi:hypothetical protein